MNYPLLVGGLLLLLMSIAHSVVSKRETLKSGRLCAIGDVPWTPEAIRKEIDPFLKVYIQRPVKWSREGSNLFHAFAQWCLIRMLKPKYIIESGAMLGWGTWMMRQAASKDTHIVVISPQSPNVVAMSYKRHQKYYIDSKGTSTYLTDASFQDFNAIDWNTLGIDSPEKFQQSLVYFDDHQSAYRRLVEAQRAGFIHIMYDDGYPWPGDNYALKQTCDYDGWLTHVKNSVKVKLANDSDVTKYSASFKVGKYTHFSYHDDFSKYKKRITLAEKQCIFHDFVRRVDTYYEFPPLWGGPFRGRSNPLIQGIKRDPVLDEKETEDLIRILSGKQSSLLMNIFKQTSDDADTIRREESSRYTFFTYVKVVGKHGATHSDFTVDCLRGLPKQYSLNL